MRKINQKNLQQEKEKKMRDQVPKTGKKTTKKKEDRRIVLEQCWGSEK